MLILRGRKCIKKAFGTALTLLSSLFTFYYRMYKRKSVAWKQSEGISNNSKNVEGGWKWGGKCLGKLN